MKNLQRIILCILLLTMVFSVLADDGMWMPHQMKDLNLLQLGLRMDPKDLYKKNGTGLMSAIVSLGGGTGEFVSENGLILTNHHVAFGALQRASDPENDYITDGFIAWETTEEIPAQGYIADVLIGYKDITRKVLRAEKKGMTLMEKADARQAVIDKLIAKAKKKGPDLRCRAASMYSGNKYYLFTFKHLTDIRLVYAPPRDLGNFGGEVDNWMWPRHTCDFSFLRAYVSKDGQAADYSEENVPYKPKSIVKLSLEGVKDGDFTFVMGYPGRTYRNNTAAEVKGDLTRMEESIKDRLDIIAFYEKAGEGSREVQIKYAGKLKGLYNGLKNYRGKLEGMEKIDLIGKKKAQGKTFQDWVKADAKRTAKYETAIDDIKTYLEKRSGSGRKTQVLGRVGSGYYGSTVLSQANTVYGTVKRNSEEPDEERDLSNTKRRIRMAERGYDFETDRAYLKHYLKQQTGRPEDELPNALKHLHGKSGEDVDGYVDGLYDGTVLGNPDERVKLVEMSLEDLMALNDPMIQLAADLAEEREGLGDDGRERAQELRIRKKAYLEGLLEMKDDNMAPDANGTIRFTYGTVEGYKPRDAVYYKPLTTLKGVIEKDTGTPPFHVPDKLKELYAGGDFGPYVDNHYKEVPACFLNTTNVTGGSSGSPTLNAKGEQVGIIFDMTYESVIGDYYVIPELQRTISVDIRYILYITDKFSGANHLLKEMKLQ
jgi:hypothetical protein